MPDRFHMATAPVAWARHRFSEFTAYDYEARCAELLTCSLQIAVKEILDHLRSALDYCARAVLAGWLPSTTARAQFLRVGRTMRVQPTPLPTDH